MRTGIATLALLVLFAQSLGVAASNPFEDSAKELESMSFKEPEPAPPTWQENVQQWCSDYMPDVIKLLLAVWIIYRVNGLAVAVQKVLNAWALSLSSRARDNTP